MVRSPPLPVTSLAYALAQAADIVGSVFVGQSLADGALSRVDPKARPAVQDLVYGTLRRYGRGDFLLSRLLERPLSDMDVHALLLVSLYRLETRPDSPHTVVDQAVSASAMLAGGRLRGLVNAVLRNYLRRQDALQSVSEREPVASHQHPLWWIEELQTTYPSDWPAIAAAGNQAPPMAIRVNQRLTTPDAMRQDLVAAGIEISPLNVPELASVESAILLSRPCAVDELPGFRQGRLSIQDPGAQLAAYLLDPVAGSRVLDACAAPGGKTAHLLERQELDLLALDLKPARCRRIEENLDRLGLRAKVAVGDASRRDGWWDGRPFDAILADVPCTASGVVRRHPDAKWLRRPEDIATFARNQRQIIDSLWTTLRPGGRMLYATCSVFAAENGGQIKAFLERHANARLLRELQLLPNAVHDGFFYALLEKAG